MPRVPIQVRGSDSDRWGEGCCKIGVNDVVHIEQVLYRYRKNPESVVHKPVLYRRLIRNIERILLTHGQRHDATLIDCNRIGRSGNTNAAHYAFTRANGSIVRAPYFNYESLELTV